MVVLMAHFKGEQKIADQVVYEGDVDNVEINDEVIRTYCEVIGIDYDNEKELLWIAEEGMRAPIPKPCRDTNSDELYYFNFQTGESQWDHPLDGFYSNKVVEEREKLKSRSRGASGRNVPDHPNPLESRTQPFTVPVSGQPRTHGNLANTLPADAKINSSNYSSPSPVKEDGKRFLKSSKKSSDDDFGGSGAREERVMFDLDDQIGLSSPVQHGTTGRQESQGYEDDYDEDVDFGDGDDRHLSALLEKESTIEPELANLASTGDHETGTSQFSQGAGNTGAEPVTNNSGPMVRPRNPLAESSRVAQSMTATSFDASEYLAQREPADLDARLKAELHNIQLELLEEHDTKIRQLKSEYDENYTKEEAQLKQEAADKIQKIKEELDAEVKKEETMKDDKVHAIEDAKHQFEEETRRKIEELRTKTFQLVESERKALENREDEITKRLAAARADVDVEVDRRLGTERSVLESEYAARVAVLRKEMAALHESEMVKLRTYLEEANYREQEAKRAEVRAAEQRVSSVRVLESEMAVSLDRRRTELRDEHEKTLSQIRRDQERAIAAAKHDAELEISKIHAEADGRVEDMRRKISDETDRQLAEAKADGDRARQTALTRLTGLEGDLKVREERVAKRTRELDELERRLNEKERQLKSKQDEVKYLTDDLAKEEANLASQKAALEKKRAELSGIQRSLAIDEMVSQHAQKAARKDAPQKHAAQGDDNHSPKSLESSSKDSSSKRRKMLKKAHDKEQTSRHAEEDSVEEEVEEEEQSSDAEDPTTVDQTSTLAASKRVKKGKEKPHGASADVVADSSCSSGEEDDGTGLGRNGRKVRKMLLNLLFPNQKLPAGDGDDENAHAHSQTTSSTASRHSKTRQGDVAKLNKHLASVLNPPSFNAGFSDEDDSDIDLNEIRSRIRSERLRAVQKDQRHMLQGSGAEQSLVPSAQLHNETWNFPNNTAEYRPYYTLQNHRASTSDIDRYLAARWYQLYRGSAYSMPLRSQNSWQLPIASTSTKYGYVPARELLSQYSASKLANTNW